MRELIVTAMLAAFWILLAGVAIYGGLLIARTPQPVPPVTVRLDIERAPYEPAGRTP